MQTNEGWLTEVKNKEIKSLQARVAELDKALQGQEGERKQEEGLAQRLKEVEAKAEKERIEAEKRQAVLAQENEEIKENTQALLDKLEQEKLES